MVRSCSRVHHTREFLKPFKQTVLKFSTHIVVELRGESKTWDEIIEDLVCSSNSSFISCRICLRTCGEVVNDNQDIFIAS